jgi:hypothetical protein
MKRQKPDWIRLFAWMAVATLFVTVWVKVQNAERDEMERINPWLKLVRWRENGGVGSPPKILEGLTSPNKDVGLIVMTSAYPKVITLNSNHADEQKTNLARAY